MKVSCLETYKRDSLFLRGPRGLHVVTQQFWNVVVRKMYTISKHVDVEKVTHSL